jgi:hypothetical protein
MVLAITYRAEKGAPLTSEEVDANFRSLEEELAGLAGKALEGEGIGEIAVSDGEMTIRGDRGTNFGTFPLPVPRGRGEWAEDTAYEPLDIVTRDGAGWMCGAAHVSGDFGADAGYWDKIVDRGADAAGVAWLGDWDPGTGYVQGDGVAHGGELYVALAASTGEAPPDPAYWRRLGPAEGEGASAEEALLLSLVF